MNIRQPGAHLDHMLRQTRQHHVQLSVMADLKANMLLTIAAVMLSVTVPYVRSEHFRGAALVLMAFCLLTIVLAAYAAMPKLPLSVHPDDAADVRSAGFNLLFFGDFTRLNYLQFEQAMEDIMNDHSRMYEAQLREIYTLGCFLATKKYRFLRLAYLSFIVGLLASGAVLAVSGVLN